MELPNMRENNIRGLVLLLLVAGLQLWALQTPAREPSTFERTGVIREIDPIDEQVVIDGRRYVLPTAVYHQATNQQGERITLQQGMRVSFYGSVGGGSYQIEGINFLHWSDR